ncbi:rab GTPase-binding effector protein 1-like [Vespa mandarinia]|uniref:rab GTPase-binding effector protein 1-like n=1 Tax=Vespa mandarinia TaxID=7446 RepID=UPI00161DCB8B|nr:rab GTPase-binding effector protein 1-like [Vespa mandarinia]XP_035736908.1 rab GTPase-binding effector protein 1-like [Vespa mandarinia]XP_035736919.1 rab GTPase-binding effector protein 1-like [Vespa mandarinia]XP_035736930.1 rab GTPase-binding effector protein 1-like [Vespa mandarinia]XP_035736941.1 rab GTPase-binding effector protein 1-like [Vespa mandarinia]XP_035736951.1 rab GTPase-binding effector protein 1-like [Vespa mandarinia]
MENHSQESHVVETDGEETLEKKISCLETENTKMREEFNMQRAKMKELFLQKEEELKRRLEDNISLQDENLELKNELDEAKSQLVVADLKIQNDILIERQKAQEEIASLQQVIHETVEESSCVRKRQDTEISKLKLSLAKLQEENVMLKSQLPREPQLDGPQISLSTVTKTLARKVASQLGADALSLGPDNLEENMRKAQEDAEVLRSLVVPLEHEIKALKEKLRTTDDELQKCKEGQLLKKQQESGSSQEACDMCRNYEAQLVKIQENVKDLEKQLVDSERMLNVQKDDLAKEVEFRHEMEQKWNEKKEEHKIKVAELTDISQTAQKTLLEIKKNFEHIQRTITDELSRLTREREEVQKHLLALQKQNENLMGKHSKHSHQLQSESINMPNNVEDLHLSLLKTHEDLIMARVAQEVAEENERTLRSEVNLLREEMVRESAAKEQQVLMLKNDISEFKLQLDKYARDQRSFTEKEEKLDQIEKKYEEVLREKEKADLAMTELKQRVTSLQQELDTSETVQKDFVRLSQSLQVQLERIRQAGSEVRWQHEEDVDECPSCHVTFTVTKKKVHCRHCGHIFCQSCLSRVVNSGPKQRPSRVCDVCHTLLVQDTAPYFSQEPPHTPD